jgi:hypothetical protein
VELLYKNKGAVMCISRFFETHLASHAFTLDYLFDWLDFHIYVYTYTKQDMAIGMIGDQFVNLLKQTALHSLLNAISLPYALVSATHVIDGVWTLAMERADEAGK